MNAGTGGPDRLNRMVGRRVQVAREAGGLTQADLGGRMGFKDRQTLSAIETGIRAVSAAELLRFAEILTRPMEFFIDRLRLVGEGEFSWRTTAEPSLLAAYEEKAGGWIAAFRVWSEDLDMPWSPALSTLSLPRRPTDAEVWQAAERLRSTWGCPQDAPAGEVLAKAAQELHTLVLHVEAPPSISGAACHLPDLNALLVNRADPPGRRAFDSAHELFHLLTWSSFPPDHIDSDRPAKPAARRVEAMANQFAAALLMPGSGMTQRWQSRGEASLRHWLAATATAIGVSAEALYWRLRNLGLLSDGDALEMAEGFPPAYGESTPVPALFSREFAERLQRALKTGEISLRRAADLLDCYLEDVDALLQSHGLQAVYEG